ncbi:MAG: Fe-S cluster assembly protein SufD [Cyclobacteriaceae bacterium]
MIKEQSILLDKLENSLDSSSKVKKEAWEMLQEVGLPSQKSESYKYTQITSILEKKADFDLVEQKTFDKKELYKTSGSHLVVINGVFSKPDSLVESGVFVDTEEVTEGKHDPFSLLNTAFSPEEITIKTKGEVSPIFLYQVNSVGFSNPRIKVSAGKSQEISIVEKSINESNTFCNSYISFDLDENSKINYSKIQAYNEDSLVHETIFAEQLRDSRFYSNIFTFSGGLVRNNITINLADENCVGYMNGLYILDGKSHVDNNTSVDHLKPNSYSNELYKGILDEKSTGIFNGKIYVRPDAQKTNAFQTNNNILLSENASIHTKPQLEIWADDVKCSHGCTSGQLDEDAIFYLRSRGISEKNAKAMILNAYAAETASYIPVKELKEEVEHLISNKLI